MEVRVGLAGHLRVAVDRRTLGEDALGGRRGRLLFAYLVAHRDRLTTREELAHVLWAEELPPTWQPALRGVVSTVRSALGAVGLPGSETLTGAAGRYQLVLPPDSVVDLDAAEQDVREGRRLLAGGKPERAGGRAEAARVVAARSFLPGEDGEWVERLRARLAHVLVEALELASASLVARGDGAAAVAPAEEAVALEPFRESAHLRLLQAYAAAGNRGEALRAYDRFRKLLAEELGVDPSPELESAYLELLRSASGATEPRLPVAGRTGGAGWAGPVTYNALADAAGPERGPFVGRDAELSRLHSAWRRAAAGHRQVGVLTGEAGIGKTRLAAELAATVQVEGGTVLYGRCDDKLSVAYLAFREALGGYMAACRTGTVRTLAAATGGELVRVLPELTRRLPELPRPAAAARPEQRYELFEAVADLLGAVCATGPVLLVVDDLQWAGTEELLLRHLARSTRQLPLLILAVHRTEDGAASRLADTLVDLQREPGFLRVRLGGLGAGDVERLVQAQQDGPADPRQAATLLDRTDGNPFFLGELIRHRVDSDRSTTPPAFTEPVASSGPAEPGGLMDLAGTEVPASVQDMLDQRLARLAPDVTRALDVAAAVGRDFDLAVVAGVAALEHEALLAALDSGVQAGLVVASEKVPGRYGFTHTILRDAVYRRLPPARRARLHLRVGETLERLDRGPGAAGRPAELAHHFGEAARLAGLEPAARAAEKAVDYAVAAAERAEAQLAYAESERQYAQALAHLALTTASDPAHRCDLLLALGAAQVHNGRVAAADQTYLAAFELAGSLGSVDRQCRAALGVGGDVTAWWGRSPVDAGRLLREALAALGPADSALRALLLSRTSRWMALTAAPPEVLAVSDSALEVARRVGEPATLATVLVDRASLLGSEIDRVPELRSTTADLLRLGAELGGTPPLVAAGHYWRLYCTLALGDAAAVDGATADWLDAADRAPTPFLRWASAAWRAARATACGELAAAERFAVDAAALGEGAGGLLAEATAASQLLTLRWLQGRSAEQMQRIEELYARAPTLPWGPRLAWLHAELGHTEQARTALAAHGDRVLGGPGRERIWRAQAVDLAEACVLLGDRDRAAELYRLLQPYGEHVLLETTDFRAVGWHYLGLLAATLGRWDAAADHLGRALTAHRRLGAVPWVALSQHATAGVLRARGGPGDVDRARELAGTARGTAAALGLRPLGGPLPFETADPVATLSRPTGSTGWSSPGRRSPGRSASPAFPPR